MIYLLLYYFPSMLPIYNETFLVYNIYSSLRCRNLWEKQIPKNGAAKL